MIQQRKCVNPNIILAKLQQLSWWASKPRDLAHQDNCCGSYQFNPGIYKWWKEAALNQVMSQFVIRAKLCARKKQYWLIYLSSMVWNLCVTNDEFMMTAMVKLYSFSNFLLIYFRDFVQITFMRSLLITFPTA